jgi:hypothetical protein
MPTASPPVALILETPTEPSCWSAADSDAEVRSLIEPYVITNQATLTGRTLYSWTTPEQIEELKGDPTLLTLSADSNGEKGRAADLIHERAEGDPVAALLDRPEYANKRFGWISPWATLLGWSGEDYGDRLLAITLKPDAFIATLVGNSPLEWTFSDASGNPVAEEEVLANPQRLAAVYFIDPRDTGSCGGTIARAGSMFREFFVCNEGMIESWSAFTPEIHAELDRNLAALQTFRSALDAGRCEPWVEGECHPAHMLQLWLTPKEELSDTVSLYFSSLAFPNSLYAPTVATMDTLLDRLRLVPRGGQPLIHSYE